MIKNPLSVKYQDLLDQARRQLLQMQKSYPGKVLEGSMTSWSATHKIEVQKQLVKLLEKFKKNPQMDLFTEFEKMR